MESEFLLSLSSSEEEEGQGSKTKTNKKIDVVKEAGEAYKKM